MANHFDYPAYSGPFFGYRSGGTRTTYALDTAFVLGSSGKCVGIRFVAPATTTLTDVLFLVGATPGSARNLSVNVCAATSATQAGAALTNGTVAVSGGTSANTWIKATFATPPNLTVGVTYYIVIGDAAGAGSGYSIVSLSGLAQFFDGFDCNTTSPTGRVMTSSDGFATAGSGTSGPCVLCLVFGDGSYWGQSYSASNVAHANSALERGFLLSPEEDITVSFLSGYLVAGSLKIYPASSAPGGAIYSGFNGGSAFSLPTIGVSIGVVRFPPCTLVGGSQYRLVVDPTSATNQPQYFAIEDYTTHAAILRLCGLESAGFVHTEESGGSWVDSPEKIPRFTVGIAQFPAQAAGGGHVECHNVMIQQGFGVVPY